VNIQSKAKFLAKKISNIIYNNSLSYGDFKSVHSPIEFGSNSFAYLSNCLKTTWVSSGGDYVKEFSKKLSEIIDCPFVVPVSSGTSALKLSLIALGVQPGNEVLVPSFTFIASANAISHVGAEPHFVDIEEETYGMDPIKLEKYIQKKVILKAGKCINKDTGAKISALIAVHPYGNSCNILEIVKICNKYNLKLIEDCAGALGTFGKKNNLLEHVGLFGDLGCLSFNGNKIVTTGGGGAIFTKSKTKYEKLLHLSTTARIPHPYEIEHDQIGWNDRMPNLNAALGLSQLENFSSIISRKKNIYKIYLKDFLEDDISKFVRHDQFCQSNYWLNSIIINEMEDLDEFKKFLYSDLINKKIQIRVGWKPINLSKMYSSHQSDLCDTAFKVASRIINIPSNFLLKN